MQVLQTLPDGTELTIDQSGSVYINHDVREIIADFVATAPARSISVKIIEQAPAVEARKLAELSAAA